MSKSLPFQTKEHSCCWWSSYWWSCYRVCGWRLLTVNVYLGILWGLRSCRLDLPPTLSYSQSLLFWLVGGDSIRSLKSSGGTFFFLVVPGPETMITGASIFSFRQGGKGLFRMWSGTFCGVFFPVQNTEFWLISPQCQRLVFSLWQWQGACAVPNSISWEWRRRLCYPALYKISIPAHTIICYPYNVTGLQHICCKVFIYAEARQPHILILWSCRQTYSVLKIYLLGSGFFRIKATTSSKVGTNTSQQSPLVPLHWGW